MTVAALLDRVNREVASRLIPAVLSRANDAHRAGWRDCGCQWCAMKRHATVRIANVRSADRERRAELRSCLANEYRAKLKETFSA